MDNARPVANWLNALCVGDEVWWNDPDNGISSGYYKVTSVQSDTGVVESDSTILCLQNDAGSSAEVLASELAQGKPQALYPVVSCASAGVICGYAESDAEAREIGEVTIGHEGEACLLDGVTLADGTVVPRAWVLKEAARELVNVRLTLDVTYDLNGENAVEMLRNLELMCQRAIGNGMLTGESDAEVESYEVKVFVKPKPLDEDELTGFMLQRIESGDLSLEDIPNRLARFGLMEPNVFIDEMHERMALMRSEA